MFYSGTGDQSDEYFLDLDKLDKKLRRMNYSLANADIDLFGVGFPFKNWYITFGISSHSSSQVSYPHEIVSMQDGNWNLNAGIPAPVQTP